MNNDIFVFGSNREGRHGGGAALFAKINHGAVYGQATGLQGSSYAIVTKELRSNYPPVSLQEVEAGADDFIEFAQEHPEMQFQLTAIGCGLAGFRNDQIKPLFEGRIPNNVTMPPEWD